MSNNYDAELHRLKRKLQFILEGGAVVRFHTRIGLRHNTDAQHSHGVAMFCHLLSGTDDEGKPRASATLLMAALCHDLGEQVASDVSAPSKRMLGIQSQLAALERKQLDRYGLDFEVHLTADEYEILKWADMFDGMLHCCHEIALGNRMMMLPWRRWCGYVDSIFESLSPVAVDIYLALKYLYQEYTHEPSYDCFTE